MTSATERIRALLDERGVEWKAWDGVHPITVWHDETYLYEFVEYRLVNGAKQVSNCPSDNDGHCELTIKVFNCTPEQAIAATLGTGTCHNTQFAEMDEKAGKKYSMAMSALRFGGFMPEDEPAEFTCSACGETASIDWVTLYDIRFCPFCGRRVKKVAE